VPNLAALPSLFNTRIAVGAAIVAYCLLWLLAKRLFMRGGWKILPMVIGLSAILFTGNELRWAVFEGQLADAVQPGMGSARASFECERLLQGALSSHAHGGHVNIGQNGRPIGAAFLSSLTCARVKAWQGNPSGATREQIFAVHTVSHEAAHLSGILDEAKAECTGIQWDVATMTSLGASRSDAVRQVRSYLTKDYPQVPANYHSDQCRSGGAMDLTPKNTKDGVWP
jgi:hypothetical protein